MSYTVLARRYRSTNFDELIGQEHIAQTLKKAIDSGRIAHAYLFCGTRGTGKTSTARILAKCLNCEKSDKPTSKPCGKCESCLAIARGDDIDVIEIDAASNTGVDNVRDLIANSQFHPARSRFKVYIIDEVHMLSKAAFNALLKTLEEPPEHVKFILATTEPEKVLPTILSRCQRYDFRNIPTREIAEHLKRITMDEKIKAEDDALLLVAKAGAGSMRDSLSLLDRLLSVGEKELTVEMIEQLLGLPRSQLVFNLAQAIGEADVKQALMRADKMIAAGLAPDTLLGSLVDHLRNLLILRTCGPDSQLVEVPGLSMKDLQTQANRFNPVVLSQDIAVLEELRRQIRTSQAGRALLDAALVRLALAEQFNQIGDLLNEADGAPTTASSASALKKKSDEQVRRPPSPLVGEGGGEADARDVVRRTFADQLQTPTPPAEEDDDALPAVGKVWDNSGPSVSELLKQRNAAESQPEPIAVAATDSNVEPADPKDVAVLWKNLLAALEARGPGLFSLVSQGRLAEIDADGRAVIRYERKHETFVKMLERNGKKDTVRELLTQVAGEPMGVKFEVDDDAAEPQAAPTTAAVMEGPAPSAPPRPLVRRDVQPVRKTEDSQPVVPAPPPIPAVKITPELIESLRQREPMIKSLMEELGATIVKVEPPEPVSTNN
jgi:DNA polymerase III subunit gamma/tau